MAIKANRFEPHLSRSTQTIVLSERKKSIMLRAWILAGIVFMTLPGTFFGFAMLLAIGAYHEAGVLPPALMEGHGHAQVFGWIGSFVLGIGFYSLPGRERSVVRVPITCLGLWVCGVTMRWIANIYSWHWHLLVPLSAAFELIAVFLFVSSASHHKLPQTDTGTRARSRMELWMVSVLLGTAGLTAAVIFNFVECMKLSFTAASPSFPHDLDQKYLVLLGWGFLVPMVSGFSARWLPVFLGLAKTRRFLFAVALIVDLVGVLIGIMGFARIAVLLLAVGTVTCVIALRFFEHRMANAKTQGVHSSFPFFATIPYLWVIIAGFMSVWAAFADHHGGIWGASRHALTVGFAATMVFAIGPRILPHFGGIYRIFSTRIMLVSLLLLQAGCTLRVSSEPLAYEGILPAAWNVLPISGVLELGGVLLFAANLALTFAFGQSAFAKTPSHSAAA